MEPDSRFLLALLAAETIDDAAHASLLALVQIATPHAACLLLWDGALERYIIGDTWVGSGLKRGSTADFRRQALRLGQQGYALGYERSQVFAPDAYYQPLVFQNQHIGAYIALGLDVVPDLTENRLLLNGIARMLSSVGQTQITDREQAKINADRERLEKLLQAVDQQQRTIDGLLAVERQFSASLESKVEERTAALRLAQERLMQSEKLAVIGQLASSLAHELNNPLQAIQSGVGLLMDEIASGQLEIARQDLTVVQAELERIESIFRQMLDFYRPVSYETVPLDLNAICEGVQILMRKRLQEANVTLRLGLSAALPLTCGDSNQIKQVLLNLILNAAEAMAPAGGTIWLRTVQNGRYICLRVADNGPGIPIQLQSRLFEPLFTTKTRGLGLGLAISQEIVHRHQGTITVDSTQGTGATFILRLPIRENCNGQG